jgi:hypothetical protein
MRLAARARVPAPVALRLVARRRDEARELGVGDLPRVQVERVERYAASRALVLFAYVGADLVFAAADQHHPLGRRPGRVGRHGVATGGLDRSSLAARECDSEDKSQDRSDGAGARAVHPGFIPARGA